MADGNAILAFLGCAAILAAAQPLNTVFFCFLASSVSYNLLQPFHHNSKTVDRRELKFRI